MRVMNSYFRSSYKTCRKDDEVHGDGIKITKEQTTQKGKFEHGNELESGKATFEMFLPRTPKKKLLVERRRQKAYQAWNKQEPICKKFQK